ncbi:MAG: tetratricopeptide repeat protein, partial [Planctomycetota bacterium]
MKPRIFISAVSSEFGTTRQSVANIITRLGYEPVMQEIFGTEPGDVRAVLRDKIDACDGLIQIVGHAYGFAPPKPDPEFGEVSYTQYEFLYARQAGKKTWLIVAADACERDTPVEELDCTSVPDGANAETLRQHRMGLQQAYREGILSGNEHLFYLAESTPSLELTVERLRDELSELRQQADRTRRRTVATLACVLSVLVLLTAGTWWSMQNVARGLSEQSRQTIRGRLLVAIEETYQLELGEAESILEWRERDAARRSAADRKETRVSEIDDFLSSITTNLENPSKEYLELLRILEDQGVDEALAFVEARKPDLFATAAARKEGAATKNRRTLAPVLTEAELLISKGQYIKALESCERALEIAPGWPEMLHQAWLASAEHSDLVMERRGVTEAKAWIQKGWVLAQQLAESDPGRAQVQRDLSISLNKLGDVSVQAGDLDAAREFYQQSLDIDERLAESDSGSAQAQRDLSISLNKLGDVSVQAGDLDAAREFYQQSLEIQRQLAESDSGSAQEQRDLSISLERLGDVSVQAGDLDAAREFYQQSLDIDERLAESDSGSAQAQRDL